VLTLVGAAWWQERARIASTGRSYAEYWEGREGEEGEGEADKAADKGERFRLNKKLRACALWAPPKKAGKKRARSSTASPLPSSPEPMNLSSPEPMSGGGTA
jgi:hypothetical protein